MLGDLSLTCSLDGKAEPNALKAGSLYSMKTCKKEYLRAARPFLYS